MTDRRRCVAYGKQVFLDDRHIADAADPDAAQVIADCVEYAGFADCMWPDQAAVDRVTDYLA